jgi:CheY-like chemotaxis protein
MNHLKSVLLVEDDVEDVELTLEALSQHNLANEVVAVRDGVEALDYLYCRGQFESRMAGNPAVILLDIKMPKVTGLQVLKTIKADENLKIIPVVMLTSSLQEPDLTASYQLGVNAYVVKPVDFQEFVKVVRRLGIFWAVLNERPPGSIRKAL